MTDNEKRAHDLAIAYVNNLAGARLSQGADKADYVRDRYFAAYEDYLKAFQERFPSA